MNSNMPTGYMGDQNDYSESMLLGQFPDNFGSADNCGWMNNEDYTDFQQQKRFDNNDSHQMFNPGNRFDSSSGQQQSQQELGSGHGSQSNLQNLNLQNNNQNNQQNNLQNNFHDYNQLSDLNNINIQNFQNSLIPHNQMHQQNQQMEQQMSHTIAQQLNQQSGLQQNNSHNQLNSLNQPIPTLQNSQPPKVQEVIMSSSQYNQQLNDMHLHHLEQVIYEH
jgi:hypothetical protein